MFHRFRYPLLVLLLLQWTAGLGRAEAEAVVPGSPRAIATSIRSVFVLPSSSNVWPGLARRAAIPESRRTSEWSVRAGSDEPRTDHDEVDLATVDGREHDMNLAYVCHDADYPWLTHSVYQYLDRRETLLGMRMLASARPFVARKHHLWTGAFERSSGARDALRKVSSRDEDARYRHEGVARRKLRLQHPWKPEEGGGWQPVRRLVSEVGLLRGLYRDGIHFASFADRDSRFSFALQPVYGIDVFDTDDERGGITRFTTGFRIEGAYDRHWHYMVDFRDHAESGNGPYDSRGRLYEDRWAAIDTKEKDATSYDISESLIQYYGRDLAITAGRGRHQWGPSQVGGLFLNGYGPPFDYVRFDGVFDSRQHPWAVYYTFLHGFLESTIAGDTLYTLPDGRPRTINNQKYLSAQRIEVRPGRDFIWGLSQGVIYGDRGLQLGYLTPLNWLYSVQHSNDDKDNLLLAADAKWRVTPGLKLYGELLMDDVVVGDLFSSTGNNKSAYTVGVHGMVPRRFWSRFDARMEYTKIRPFVYTHFFETNQYSHWTSPLGYSREPNSEFITTELRGTFYPVQVTLHYSRQNHGASVVDENGAILRNVGGDINVPNLASNDLEYPFLDGRFERTTRLGLTVTCELLPGLMVHAGGTSIDESSADIRLETRFGLGWNL